MEDSAIQAPTLEDINSFMLLTPLPQIEGKIDFQHIFDLPDNVIENLNKARSELEIAFTEQIGDVKLGIRTAEEYFT